MSGAMWAEEAQLEVHPSASWWEVSGSWLLAGSLNEGYTVSLEML